MSQRAVVVFVGRDLVDNPAWYARFLKPGFAHCFLLVESNGGWVCVEGHSGSAVVSLVTYQNPGATVGTTVVETVVRAEPIRSLLVARSCVGLTKSVLGLRSWAITPWQLYKHLRAMK